VIVGYDSGTDMHYIEGVFKDEDKATEYLAENDSWMDSDSVQIGNADIRFRTMNLTFEEVYEDGPEPLMNGSQEKIERYMLETGRIRDFLSGNVQNPFTKECFSEEDLSTILRMEYDV
jgi:hypothetical protein